MKIKEHHFLPNIFIPGAGKSGTSSLHDYLNAHPDICMSKVKEPHFWTNPSFNTFTNIELENYLSLFDGKTQYRGESSTGYLFFEDFIFNIRKSYKKYPKFIIVLRNPIDRTYSHYWWLKGIGSEKFSLRNAILKDKDILPNQSLKLPEQHYKNYYQFGLYGKSIDKFYNTFGRDHIHIITTEKLQSNNLDTINSCFSFLGLKTLQTIPNKKINKTKILKFPWLYKNVKKIALSNSPYKRIVKPFFHKSIRKALNENLHPLIYKLTATERKYPSLKKEDRQWIKQLYLDDVKHLKYITGMPFNEWEDFRD